MSSHETDQAAIDTADLERFGYKQELKRELGTFSSFAVAFSYISPSTGIFALFGVGMAALGAYLFWTWPVVALFQFIVALNFAELSSHFPVAGSVYQWTKYLSGRGYAWFTGWFYLIAGILTVASVCATLPIALLPMINNIFGSEFNTSLGSADQAVVAVVTLVVITVLNIYGVRFVAIVNNTGVVFEILGMVVFAIFLAIAHNNQGLGVIVDSQKTGNIFEFPAPFSMPFFLVGMFMSLYVIYGFDTASTLAEETRNPRQEAPKAVLASVIGSFIIGAIFLWGVLIAVPEHGRCRGGILRTAGRHRERHDEDRFDALPAGRLGRDLRLLHVDPDLDDQARLRHGARQSAAVLGDDGEGQPTAPHAGRGVHHHRSARGDPVPPVLGSDGHRRRRDRLDLPQLPAREPRRDAGSDAWMAEDEGAVLARSVGQGRERRRDPLGRR